MGKETLEITYDMAKEIISRDLETMSQKFISIGYHLKLIRDKHLYTQDGYKDIWEFAQSAYGISKSTCSRWMSMNDKFSEGGNSPELKEEFRKFGKSQLQEMLYLTDEQIEQAKPEMTAKEIREIRKPENRTPDPEEIMGQMKIQDYPEFLPEEKIPYFAFEGEPYGWTWSEVVKAYLKNGYEKPESGTEVKCLGKMYLVLRRKEKTFFYDGQGNTLFEVDNKRLEEEFEFTKRVNTMETAAEPERIPPEVQQEEAQTEPVAPAQQHISPIERGCITGLNPNGTCACCGNEGTVECCGKCEDRNSCNVSCGWLETEQQEAKEESQTKSVKLEQQTEKNEKYEQTSDKTDMELLKEELKEEQKYLMLLLERFTEKDIRVRKQKLIVGALAGMIAEIDNEIPEPAQSLLPKMRNNDQRKKWLRNYRSWGIWYKDEHIGATYYRYNFDNGATLIVEEYEKTSRYTGKYISSYYHLIGGPEPERENGIPKWTYNETYNRYQNSETELVEFLKEIQKHG